MLPDLGMRGDGSQLAWIELPENQAAWQAVQGVYGYVQPSSPRKDRAEPINPLFVHGPPGSGKTHLLGTLTTRISRAGLDLVVAALSARDLATPEDAPAWQDADLILVEDIQHLAPRAIETMVFLVDRCLSRRRPLIATATEGPARLTTLPVRLTSRLSQGLVVALHPLTPASRLAFLRQRAKQLSLTLTLDVSDWLVNNTPGSVRQLEGALRRVADLVGALGRSISLADIESAFRDEAEHRRLTLEQITQQVGAYFRVDPRAICSRHRGREVLLPRQIGMYLARQLTSLSLEQIGTHFGGRDHSTVLHACRKVADALPHDAQLSGAVRRLEADLG